LPDISALNGTAIDSVAEFDGLTVTAAVAFTGLLDTYTGAAAGYSTRRLASSATNLMRIREDAGDTETDIGYDSNNELDTAAIATHCGTANGFVVTWYDQSGNSNNATQSTSGSQPQIYNGTSVITQNGKPAVTFNSDKLVKSSITNTDLCTTNAHTSVTVFNDTSSSGFKGVWGTDDRVIDFVTRLGNTNWQYSYDSDSTPELRGYTAAASDYNRQNLSTVYKGSTNGYWRLNGSQIDSGAGGTTVNTGTTNLELGESVNLAFTGNLQEVISWPTDNYDNRTAIESNINSEFLIYQPTDAPTSGLLATYTGAAAAYSVRQLSDKAVIALRIRRDSDDEETNIGFDSNGDLDTTAISDFCSTANGFVTRWWDQSTNGNHADQATDAIQPQIYNGTAVITENGKPYLKYGFLTTAVNFGTDNWIFSACGNISNNTKLFFAGSGSSYVGLAQSGSTSSTINSGAGTLTAFRNGSSYSFTTRDALYTDIGTQSLFTINQDNSGWTNVNLGYTGSVDQRMYSLHEVVIYDTDQSTNRTGIESDMNTYFSIY